MQDFKLKTLFRLQKRMKTNLLCLKYIKGGGCFYHFSIICSTFVAGFRISAIPKDIVGKRNGVRYLIQRPRNVGSFKE